VSTGRRSTFVAGAAGVLGVMLASGACGSSSSERLVRLYEPRRDVARGRRRRSCSSPGYDVDVWQRLGWGLFAESQDRALRALLPDAPDRDARLAMVRAHVGRCLAHARRFHEALDRPATPPPGLAMHLFAGDTEPTRAVLEVDRETGAIAWRGEAPGDDTVTRTSALGERRADPGAPPAIYPTSVHFVRSNHLDMTADAQVLDHLLYLLLEAPTPGGGAVGAPAPADESTSSTPAAAAESTSDR